MTIKIQQKIFIKASKEDVWDILTDFKGYRDWNPFMKSISGELLVGNRITVNLWNMSFRPKILSVEPNNELTWIGRLFITGILDGKHQFIVSENKNNKEGVFFEQIEEFSGLLTVIFKKRIEKEVSVNFSLMNLALKDRVESK